MLSPCPAVPACAVCHTCVSAAAAGRPRRGVAAGAGPGKEAGLVAPVQGSFSFLCLHAAVALTPLIPSAHSLLLTSGTLSPMDPLVAELGIGAKPAGHPQSEVEPKPGVIPKPGFSPKPGMRLESNIKLDGKPGGELRLDMQNAVDLANGIPAWAKPKAENEAMANAKTEQSELSHQSDEQQASAELCSTACPQQALPLMEGETAEVKSEPMLSAAGSGTVTVQNNDHQQSPVAPLSVAPPTAAPSAAAAASAVAASAPAPEMLHVVKSESVLLSTAELDMRRASNASATPSTLPDKCARQRSQHSRLHQQVELVSAPHNPTLPQRLLPLTISMAPGRNGQLVKLDSAYDKRQDEGEMAAVTALFNANPPHPFSNPLPPFLTTLETNLLRVSYPPASCCQACTGSVQAKFCS